MPPKDDATPQKESIFASPLKFVLTLIVFLATVFSSYHQK